MSMMKMQRMVNAPISIEIYDTNATPEVPYNLTGLSVKFTVKQKSDVADNDDAALIKRIITVHTDAVNGLTSFTPDETERLIPVGVYKADIKLFNEAVDLNCETFDLQVIDVTGKEKE
jgi:hypothetical protein